MTKAQLAELVVARTKAFKSICKSTLPLARLEPAERQAVDAASADFRAADAAIVAELRRRNEPVEITIGKRKSLLWLLQVADQFVELDPATGQPLGWGPGEYMGHGQVLYRYPEAKRAS